MSSATYECNEECSCPCLDQALESDWYWDPDLQCWICTGCAKIQ